MNTYTTIATTDRTDGMWYYYSVVAPAPPTKFERQQGRFYRLLSERRGRYLALEVALEMGV